MIDRRLFKPILQDLKRKMCWVTGPRQCGKTTLAEQILKKIPGRYYNWDVDSDRDQLKKSILDPDAKLWAFDEIHKYRRWRNWLKGLYDQNRSRKKFLVTGSARIDIFSRGGDSLQGRYHLHRMHPITLTEYLGCTPSSLEEFKEYGGSHKALQEMLRYGGFPEPLQSQNDKEAARWRLAYSRQLFRDDIRDLDLVKDLDSMSLLLDRLPDTVGSVLSINSLREDLEKNFATIKNWIGILDNLFASFRVSPFGHPKIKAVKKEQKLYLWDWARVQDPAARFENLVALHLLRYCHWLEDVEGKATELRYIRDQTGKEVDFVVVSEKKPLFAVECKLSGSKEVDKNLKYFAQRLPIQNFYQVHLDKKSQDYESSIGREKRIRVIPAHKFLSFVP